MLLGSHAIVIVRRGLDVPGLGLADSLGRMLPDFLLHKPLAVAQGGLAHQLGAVSALGAHIVLLHLCLLYTSVPICSPAPTMWASTRAIPWSMKSPRNI